MRAAQMKKVFSFFFVLLFFMSAVKLAVAITLSPEEVEVITLINEERALLGLDPFYHNAQLSEAAARHSEDMFTNDFLSHTGSDGSTPWDRIDDAGYTGTAYGEVIGYGTTSAELIVDAWMNSEPHYNIIMYAEGDRIGVGHESGYWTVDVGIGGSIDAVPIPATLWLFGFGLAGLLGLGRKIKNPSKNS